MQSFKITITGWKKHNSQLKKGHTHFQVFKRIFADDKISRCTVHEFRLYMYCLSVCADLMSDTYHINSGSIPSYFRLQPKSFMDCLRSLQEKQLVTVENLDVFINRIEKKGIEKKGKEENSNEPSETSETDDPQKPPLEQESFFPTRPSKAQSRGVIPELEKDQTCVIRMQDVTEKVQRAWLIAYPNADWICQEIRKANAWCETNPHKAPKKFDRFMNSWLSRAFEDYRKGLQSKHRTHAQKNSDALQEMRDKIDRGEL